VLNIESGLDLKAQVEREEWVKHTLFTFERVVAPDGKVITTKFAVGSALVWAVVLIILCLKGHALVSLPASVFGYLWGKR
jgi:hypothetical protein